MSFTNTKLVVPIKRVMVFIDGGYFRESLKRIFNDDILDYQNLRNLLSTEFQDDNSSILEIVRTYYYDAIAEDERDSPFMQRMYIDSISQTQGFENRLGTLKLSKRLKQKGVDTLLAIDMLSKAYQNQYDIAVLISGDEDFLPVVQYVKDTGKLVYGVFLGKHYSQPLWNSLDKRISLEADFLLDKFIRKSVSIGMEISGEELRVEVLVGNKIEKEFGLYLLECQENLFAVRGVFSIIPLSLVRKHFLDKISQERSEEKENLPDQVRNSLPERRIDIKSPLEITEKENFEYLLITYEDTGLNITKNLDFGKITSYAKIDLGRLKNLRLTFSEHVLSRESDVDDTRA